MAEERSEQEYVSRSDRLKAFLTACSEGDLDTVRSLVEDENVDIETKSMSGAPGVFFAAQGGFVPVLRFLDERGANFRATDFGGSTPFHEAGRKGHPEAIDFMCTLGARIDIHETDGQGWNALTCAAAAGHVGTVRGGRTSHRHYHHTTLPSRPSRTPLPQHTTTTTVACHHPSPLPPPPRPAAHPPFTHHHHSHLQPGTAFT